MAFITFTQMVWVSVNLSGLDLGMQCRQTCIIKRHLAAYEDIKNNTETPNIDFGTGIMPCLQQLRCSEIQGPTERAQQSLGRVNVGQAKINNFDVLVASNQDIFYFQICPKKGKTRGSVTTSKDNELVLIPR